MQKPRTAIDEVRLGGSTSRIHLRFAIASTIVLAAVAALSVFAGRALVVTGEHQAAARSADRLVGAPLRSILDAGLNSPPPTLSDDARQQADGIVKPLLASDITSLRVWTHDGTLLYGAGASAPGAAPSLPSTASLSYRTSGNGDADLFSTFVSTGAYVIQIDEDAAAVEARIAGQQRAVLNIVLLASVVIFALMQSAFWIVVRGLSAGHRRLTRLYVAGEELRQSLDLHDVLTRLARDATLLGRGEFGLVALFDHGPGDLLLRATYEKETDTISHHQRAVEEWFLRRAVVTRTTIVSAQAASAYRQFFGDAIGEDGEINVLCVPVALRDRVSGVVAVVRMPTARRTTFASAEVREVGALAVQAAMAIEQAQLFAKVRSYADEVELSYDSTLKALMAALDAKDDVTEGHCERVARLTVQLARRIGVDDKALIDIERGALLHDVGKIGVPDAVLKKPRELNDLEWEAMRKHPLLAGVIVSKVGFLEGATPILLYHHERFDGGGYPFRLAGANIPIEARIFSTVDAYDAMTSHRPYRDAMTHEQAMLEVIANSGTQFDPAVAREFELMMIERPELRARPGARRLPDPLETALSDAGNAA